MPLAIAAAFSIAAAATAAPARTTKPSASHVTFAKPCSTHAQAGKVSVADLVARGDFAMQVGQYAEAIAAFEQVLKSDRNYSEAWGRLAFLYIKEGDSAKAVEAFKKAKLLCDANGGIVTRDASGSPLFP
jgi:Tfp pilus assembly protein PilF